MLRGGLAILLLGFVMAACGGAAPGASVAPGRGAVSVEAEPVDAAGRVSATSEVLPAPSAVDLAGLATGDSPLDGCADLLAVVASEFGDVIPGRMAVRQTISELELSCAGQLMGAPFDVLVASGVESAGDGFESRDIAGGLVAARVMGGSEGEVSSSRVADVLEVALGGGIPAAGDRMSPVLESWPSWFEVVGEVVETQMRSAPAGVTLAVRVDAGDETGMSGMAASYRSLLGEAGCVFAVDEADSETGVFSLRGVMPDGLECSAEGFGDVVWLIAGMEGN